MYLVKTVYVYEYIKEISSLRWRNKNQEIYIISIHKCFKGSRVETYNFHFYLRLAIFITWPSELLCTVAFCAALLAYVCRLHMHHSLDREAFTQIQLLQENNLCKNF